jgi:hypothetical protein
MGAAESGTNPPSVAGVIILQTVDPAFAEDSSPERQCDNSAIRIAAGLALAGPRRQRLPAGGTTFDLVTLATAQLAWIFTVSIRELLLQWRLDLAGARDHPPLPEPPRWRGGIRHSILVMPEKPARAAPG